MQSVIFTRVSGTDQEGEATDAEVACAAGVVVGCRGTVIPARSRPVRGHDGPDQGLQLRGVVLAVGVHGDHEAGVQGRASSKPVRKGVTLTEVVPVGGDDGSCRRGLGGRGVGAPVVDDQRAYPEPAQGLRQDPRPGRPRRPRCTQPSRSRAGARRQGLRRRGGTQHGHGSLDRARADRRGHHTWALRARRLL